MKDEEKQIDEGIEATGYTDNEDGAMDSTGSLPDADKQEPPELNEEKR